MFAPDLPPPAGVLGGSVGTLGSGLPLPPLPHYYHSLFPHHAPFKPPSLAPFLPSSAPLAPLTLTLSHNSAFKPNVTSPPVVTGAGTAQGCVGSAANVFTSNSVYNNVTNRGASLLMNSISNMMKNSTSANNINNDCNVGLQLYSDGRPPANLHGSVTGPATPPVENHPSGFNERFSFRAPFIGTREAEPGGVTPPLDVGHTASERFGIRAQLMGGAEQNKAVSDRLRLRASLIGSGIDVSQPFGDRVTIGLSTNQQSAFSVPSRVHKIEEDDETSRSLSNHEPQYCGNSTATITSVSTTSANITNSSNCVTSNSNENAKIKPISVSKTNSSDKFQSSLSLNNRNFSIFPSTVSSNINPSTTNSLLFNPLTNHALTLNNLLTTVNSCSNNCVSSSNNASVATSSTNNNKSSSNNQFSSINSLSTSINLSSETNKSSSRPASPINSVIKNEKPELIDNKTVINNNTSSANNNQNKNIESHTEKYTPITVNNCTSYIKTLNQVSDSSQGSNNNNNNNNNTNNNNSINSKTENNNEKSNSGEIKDINQVEKEEKDQIIDGEFYFDY